MRALQIISYGQRLQLTFAEFKTKLRSYESTEKFRTASTDEDGVMRVRGRSGGDVRLTCYSCGQKGHKAIECPAAGQRSVQRQWCSFCKSSTHKEVNCRRREEERQALKPSILVVLHHTLDPNSVEADSKRQVCNRLPDLLLTVDCLFNEGKLLSSKHNKAAYMEIIKLIATSYQGYANKVTTVPRSTSWVWLGTLFTGVTIDSTCTV
ncbi:hypothetical protein D4764_19G0003150 [Takifugu flavidus]|uniref:CCHC-type domain-containing protein n=1 Tax=Takifugu flavidus TaxID=433684 RepID=A0A5C6NSF6_9TELE|nr:hypothetical protein D4764_19G0003150 [Takifugu flavidus]